MAVHTPVLVDIIIQYLLPEGEGLMIDATLGEGGHSLVFLTRFPALRVIGVDADSEILEIARNRLAAFGDRIGFYSGWSQDFFSAYPKALERPDSILIDLGISLYHYEASRRGFSFRKDEYLDMRIDPSRGISAAELLRGISERDLADLIYRNGEERYSRRIARAIVDARASGAINSSTALAGIIEKSVPGAYRHGPIHPATKTFLAIRAAVNQELSQLDNLLEGALRALKIGGRMGVISFHSLEDRVVKNFMRTRASPGSSEKPIRNGNDAPLLRILTRKPVTPREEEIRSNPPARSAKFRALEKIAEEVKP